MGIIKIMIAGLTLMYACNLSGQGNPTELGKVDWIRDLDQGQKMSASTNKPILILFQEVPGCITCQRYGQGTLSHPLIVETIETYFVPVAIHNNKGGKDAEVLKYFGEPTWNNPVVRIVDKDRNELSKRLAGNYTPIGLVQSMMTAMTKSGQIIPEYLNLLVDELSVDGRTETAVYSMHCFWTGESHFGRKDGVVNTEPGFANGREVVVVEYNPQVVNKADLDQYARQASCKTMDNPKGFRIDKEPKYYMSKTDYQYVPLTPYQQTKVNGALGQRQDPSVYLSPRQLKVLDHVRNNKDHGMGSVIEVPFEQAWESVIN